ncbi:ribosome biogenesis GTP-binding protein YihA/YsxC [Buchnera aphidicola (Taiwanaphis decaspermi)]|uniref:ribosome biogenesis GTP-binding protein YihA/YsxC n=1 Tax=Buchnera aphidicola TaxID=9 RepID=UPI0031B816BF
MSKIINYNNTLFFNSFNKIKNININNGVEIVLTGYSNSGKSSLINSITCKKKLARVSKKPGRTQLINFFNINKSFRLVDLPGYGYSNVSTFKQNNMQKLINDYFYFRKKIITCIFLIIDVKNSIRYLDYNIVNFSKLENKKLIILLTKTDKFSKTNCKKKKNIIKKEISNIYSNIKIYETSCKNKKGISSIKNKLNEIYKNYNKHFITNKY